ncbi:MAG: hypothetical protein LBU62_00105 [Bacteroidales bacterium]|jgi:predicted  nucleic acid-binding Zn-ribbon protein|nr:hypothetical protein [Bacteroidales bacterium]
MHAREHNGTENQGKKNNPMNKDYGHFADVDSVLEAPDFMKVKILLTMLRKQNAYVHALEGNIEVLIEKAKELSSQLAHYKKISQDVEQQISKLKVDVAQRDSSILDLKVLLEKTSYKSEVRKLEAPKIVSKIDLDSINQRIRPVKKSKEEREKEREEKQWQWYNLKH